MPPTKRFKNYIHLEEEEEESISAIPQSLKPVETESAKVLDINHREKAILTKKIGSTGNTSEDKEKSMNKLLGLANIALEREDN